MKLIVSRLAVADIERLRAFLWDKNPSAATKAVGVLVDTIQSFETLPERGLPSGIPGVRELIVPFGGTSYVLRYAPHAKMGEVIVLRIWHGRENR